VEEIEKLREIERAEPEKLKDVQEGETIYIMEVR